MVVVMVATGFWKKKRPLVSSSSSSHDLSWGVVFVTWFLLIWFGLVGCQGD
jgi:hypothetical protein